MPDYFLVRLVNGPEFDPSRARREQELWDEHAAFMDELLDEGVVVLGGPIGDVDTEDVLLVVNVADEAEIRERLAPDPWANGILQIESVRPWTVWLRARSRAAVTRRSRGFHGPITGARTTRPTLQSKMEIAGRLLFVALVTCYLLGRILGGAVAPAEIVVYGVTAAFGLEYLVASWGGLWQRG